MRRAAKWIAGLVAALVAIFAAAVLIVDTDIGHRWVADRIAGVLKSYSEKDRAGLADPDGIIRAKCEFCGTVHEIGREALS